MGKYYDLIMEPTQGSFSNCFNKQWSLMLDDMAKPYADAIQLRIGNQLRPKLTCWGAAFNTHSCDEINLEKVAKVAGYVEMLHKASIILDDMVDGDDARHGQKTFHVEFGRDKAMLFSLALLGNGAAGINSTFRDSEANYQSVDLYTGTINRMATGCLEELELDGATRYDIGKVRNIINLETISLIKNSLVLGYWSNRTEKSDVESTILKVGGNCGYIFQMLNDLEPFSSIERNIAYKGGMNIDINRNRKNIVVAYIFGAATQSEKRKLLKLVDLELQSFLMSLYEKYAIGVEICEEAQSLEQKTTLLIDELGYNSHYTSSLDDFKVFVKEMVGICFSKLGQ